MKNLLRVKIAQANKTKMCRENREQEKHTTSSFSTFPIQNTVYLLIVINAILQEKQYNKYKN